MEQLMESCSEKVILPHTESGYYGIRLESIGGLGANLCGKLLGELAVEALSLNASAFSSYGSEKRGSAVRSYVRWCDSARKILHNSPITSPDLVGLFHLQLAAASSVTAGLGECGKIVVNTGHSPEKIRDILRLYGGEVYTVDALSLAIRTKSRVNTVMLGAIAKAIGFVPLEAVKRIVTKTLGKKYPLMLEANLKGVESGWEEVRSAMFRPDGKYPKSEYREEKSYLGYRNAPIGGVISLIGSTVQNDLSPSREGFIPLFIPEKCIHCGLCDSTCPDFVFQFQKGEYRGKEAYVNTGLDYAHCKGCLRCVEVCPTAALVSGREEECEKRYYVKNLDLVRAVSYEAAGADASITEEAYLTEKRADGGLI